METQNNSEQADTQEPTIPKLNPDFSHRLGLFDGEANALNLTDAVDKLALQADSIIAMLGSQFLGDKETVKFSDGVIFWALDSVRATVSDIRVIVAAYHEANLEP